MKHDAEEHFAGGRELRMRDDEICYALFGIEVVVNHDTGRGVLADYITEGPHTAEFSVVTHNDEVCLLHNGTHLVLVFLIDEDFSGPRYPFEKVGENGGDDDTDISLWRATTQPRGKSRRRAYGITVWTAVAGEDDTMGCSEELVPEGKLLFREQRTHGNYGG